MEMKEFKELQLQKRRDKEIKEWKESNKGLDPDFPPESNRGGTELPTN
jgi:hypothetical protein